MAPGFKCTTVGNNELGRYSQTSAATAIVSGAAALVRAAAPELSADQVVERLIRNAEPIDDPNHKLQLGRLVNCAAAVRGR
jgi:subtilisin family serine protease